MLLVALIASMLAPEKINSQPLYFFISCIELLLSNIKITSICAGGALTLEALTDSANTTVGKINIIIKVISFLIGESIVKKEGEYQDLILSWQ
ncbi:hypothetical protein [Proteus hauseri]|uniref:hypothetical protein n=1 Tax=Proteus hauseri TaxID=183417 RepID=UPI0010094BED|nr:hypothetical protein [Proteus hauseri]QAV24340.1 hypothetical protein PH4a_13725 [Proteus hauseri]